MDRLNTGHAGQRPDICSFVRDPLAGQDRTPPLRVSVCPASALSHPIVGRLNRRPGGRDFFEINPMNRHLGSHVDKMRGAPRCGARTRVGGACRAPAVTGRKRCRLHGGLSPGAPHGPRNGNYRDGSWT